MVLTFLSYKFNQVLQEIEENLFPNFFIADYYDNVSLYVFQLSNDILEGRVWPLVHLDSDFDSEMYQSYIEN